MFASYHCHHDPTSGAALCTRDLFALLAARGWACGVMTGPYLDTHSNPPIDDRFRDASGVRAERGQAGSLGFTVYNFVAPRGYPVSIVSPEPPATRRAPTPDETSLFLRLLGLAVKEFRPEVVLTYGGDPASVGVIDVARRAGAKVAFWLHNYAYQSADLLRTCDAVIVPSAHVRDHYRTALGIESVVLPGPWDWDQVKCERVGRQHVTFVNPEPTKGVFWFARLAEVLGRSRPDIPLLVVEGRESTDWLGRCGVDLVGIQSVHRMRTTTDPRHFYRASKLVLMPSLWDEAFGRVAVEAQLNAIPVIGSGRGGLSEALRPGGFVLAIPNRYTPNTRVAPSAEEVTSWADLIVRLWDDPQAYAAASATARAAAEQWHPDVLTPKWESILSALPTPEFPKTFRERT
jgi:glycosyltransferase involved in cell wall biosynthesis